MIVPDAKFIFIHIPKTGGVSINDYLIRCLCGKYPRVRNLANDTVTPKVSRRKLWAMLYIKHQRVKGHPNKFWRDYIHYTASEAIDEIGQDKFDQCFKFSFVRNPWDRLVSYYKYIKQRRDDHLKYYKIDKNISFDNFLNIFFEKHGVQGMDFLQPQTKFLFNSAGEKLVDFIARYENFDEDFNVIYERLKNQFPSTPRGLDVKRNVSVDRRHYTEFYNLNTAKLVESYYIQDVVKFGYEYGQ